MKNPFSKILSFWGTAFAVFLCLAVGFVYAQSEQPVDGAMIEKTCNYDQYIGQKPSDEIIAAIKATGMEIVDVVGELDAVTMDYVETRVRLVTDAKTGLIKMATCG